MGRGSLSRAVIAVSTVGHCRSHAPSPPRASPAKFASLFRVPFAKRRGGFLRHSLPLPPFSEPSPARDCSVVVCGGVLLGMVESVVLNRTGCM